MRNRTEYAKYVNWYKSVVVLCMVLFTSLATIPGSANPSVDLSLLQLIAAPDPAIPGMDWRYVSTADITVALKSPNTGNVRGEVAFQLTHPAAPPGTLQVEALVQRAYLQLRFPSFRLTLGKTRLDWGEGLVFNAGKVLEESSGWGTALTLAGPTSRNQWLSAVNIPLGPFSFLEAVVLPPMSMKLEETSIGARFYAPLGETKLEIGYSLRFELADPDDMASGRHLHHPYVSLQGNFGVDWQLTSSLALPTTGATALSIRDSWTTSMGLFQLLPIGYRGTLSLRLEAQIAPFRLWSEQITANPQYALMLYPEISYSIEGGPQFIVRSIISPVDASAVLMGGVQWNILQGLTLQAYLTANLGDEDDMFAKDGSRALLFGAHWVY
ncbi:MAG: hypothetical protein CVV52_01155 [Spirochaetae bacterium HGW-Spirochaetae-8]|nr:MAG: hypothetical protein CVV52_01155 [Spirochaetae bacterium HGW-Spirochaetae-8]